MAEEQVRFKDDRTFLASFADEFLVVCPRCAGCASVTPVPGEGRSVFANRRLLCPGCAYHRDREINGYIANPGEDWYFGLPLWLKASCSEGEVWAFNRRHLAWLEGYVRATLRDNRRHSEWGWSNQGAANRLPAWLKSAKNRSEVLKCIESLQRKRS
jgi:hypothetical protein